MLTFLRKSQKMFATIYTSQDIAALVIIAIFFLILGYRPPWWQRRGAKCKNGAIPGPIPLPIIGTTWISLIGTYPFCRLHEFYQDMHKKYGPVMKEEAFGNVPVINLYETADMERVLSTSGKYPLRPPVEALSIYRKTRPDRYASVGMVNEQGESWHQLRNALAPVFNSPKTIQNFLTGIDAISDDLINLLRFSRDETSLVSNVDSIADRLGFEITCSLVLGRRMGFLLPDGESDNSKKLAEAIREHFLAVRDSYFGLPLWRYFSTPTYKKLVKAEETIYELTLELVKTGNDSAVLQSILRSNIDEKEKTACVIDFMTAGIHTMKNTLLFMLHLLGRHPEIQEKIIEDPGLSYVKACLIETFRLYPTAYSLARILEEEVEVSGYCLKPGTVVVCQTGIACRDGRIYDNPDKFLPDRWINEDKKQNPKVPLIPFGIGRRICPGKRFIEQTLPVIVKDVVKDFIVVSEGELELTFEFLLAPEPQMALVFKDRI